MAYSVDFYLFSDCLKMNKFSKVQLPLSIEVNVDSSLSTLQIHRKIYWMPQTLTLHSAVTQYIWGFFLSIDYSTTVGAVIGSWPCFHCQLFDFGHFPAWIDFIPRETRTPRSFLLCRNHLKAQDSQKSSSVCLYSPRIDQWIYSATKVNQGESNVAGEAKCVGSAVWTLNDSNITNEKWDP